MIGGAGQPLTGETVLSAEKRVRLFGAAISLTDTLILTVIAVILALQLHLQFTQKVNWDEFFYLSHIYDAQAGRLDKTLQMGHVYLFRWLTFMPGEEMAQVTMGRLAMWGAQIGTLVLIFKTARRFMPATYALFAGLCFLGLGFVFLHGTSFRADPLAGLCMMMAVYVLAASDLHRKHMVTLAAALALGAFVTIKVVLFAPCLAALALMHLVEAENKKPLFIKFAVTLLTSAAAFFTALVLHGLTLPIKETAETANSLTSTANMMFLSGGLFPRMEIIKIGFFTGIIPAVMVGLGIAASIIYTLKDKAKTRQHLTMLALALPLLTFVFYRNAYPYFYAFILPSVIILAGYAAYQLKSSKLVLSILSMIILCSTAMLYMNRFDETREVQAQTLSAVHQIFPEPVSYFDRNGMIASFPKAGFFMSSWGLKNYNISGERKFIRQMEKKTIPLLVENSPSLAAALKGEPTSLFEEDAKALRENFIPHWGHIWVAGRSFNTSQGETAFTLAVPGTYTLESEMTVMINQKLYEDGDYINFDRSENVISSATEQDITLRWGANLIRPKTIPSETPIFGAF